MSKNEGAASGGTLLHVMPQGHGKGGPWSAEMDFDDGQQQVVLTLCDGAWHWWLSCWFLVCGLSGLSARQGSIAKEGHGGQRWIVMMCSNKWC